MMGKSEDKQMIIEHDVFKLNSAYPSHRICREL